MSIHERIGLLKFLNWFLSARCNTSIAFSSHHTNPISKSVDKALFPFESWCNFLWPKLFNFIDVRIEGLHWASTVSLDVSG